MKEAESKKSLLVKAPQAKLKVPPVTITSMMTRPVQPAKEIFFLSKYSSAYRFNVIQILCAFASHQEQSSNSSCSVSGSCERYVRNMKAIETDMAVVHAARFASSQLATVAMNWLP